MLLAPTMLSAPPLSSPLQPRFALLLVEPADQGDRVLLRIYAEVHETRPQLFIRPEGRVAPPEAVLQER